jgi:aminomethyltransferase
VPIGTAVHEKSLALNQSLNYREWAGYYAASAYEVNHHYEYNAIRNAAALIDITPLYKYRIEGVDAAKLIDRMVTRDMSRVAVGQVAYVSWCNEQGMVIDDGTITRLDESLYRWTAADPNLRWFRQNALGMEVVIEDMSRSLAALAIQGPTSARILNQVAEADIESLKYFRMTRGTIAGVPVEIARNGYTGDLGYEIWIPWEDAPKVWDALMEGGRRYDLHPAGMLALDMARIEAGLILIEVDYISCRKAMIEDQKYSPYEIGLGRMVHLDKEHFVGRAALVEEQRRGPRRRLVGLEIAWSDVEALYERIGLAPNVSPVPSREAVPVYNDRVQVGKATSTTWSPTLKKMIALASVSAAYAEPGRRLQMEVTVEGVRSKAGAMVVKPPFFNPPRKTAMPLL